MVVVVVNLGQNLLAVALFVRAYASVSLFSGWSAILFFLLPLLVLSCHVFFLFYFFFVRHSFADDRGSPTLASPETQKNRKKKERITRNRQRLRIVS